MKPQDLKFPFAWEKRQPLIVDNIFFIPKFYDRHEEWVFPSWSDSQLFNREAPVQIEYCSGNGAWIIEKAKAYPEMNWVAVEKRFDRVQKIWSKMKNNGLCNLFIVCGEALCFTTHYVPEDSFESIYINFPDPWPKGRHAKHRLLQEDFITELARVSKKDAIIVTDHKDYADRIGKIFLNHPSWIPAFPSPYFITEWEGYGTSYFDTLWRLKGMTIHYLQFLKRTVI